MSEKKANEVVTGKVRFSYAYVWEPKADDKGVLKYSVAILIPKTDTRTIDAIKKAIKAAYEEGKTKLNGKSLSSIRTPLRDGDVEKPDDEAYAGMMFLNAKNIHKPKIVDSAIEEIIDRDEFYSGCYGRASINMYVYTKGSLGVGVGLKGLQKLEDGERLSGATFSAEEDFGSDSELF